MKYSKQREIILNYVKDHPIHPTAITVYSSLRKAYPNLSLGTVYRNLNRLSEMGLIQKIEVADAPDRFDGNVHPHFHAVCERCGEMFDFDLNEPACLAEQNICGHGFRRILSLDVSVKCVCDSCALLEKEG